MDMKGFFNLEKPGDFTNIVDVQFIGAMGLPGICISKYHSCMEDLKFLIIKNRGWKK
jgi:hypothetical protein